MFGETHWAEAYCKPLIGTKSFRLGIACHESGRATVPSLRLGKLVESFADTAPKLPRDKPVLVGSFWPRGLSSSADRIGRTGDALVKRLKEIEAKLRAAWRFEGNNILSRGD